MKAATGVSGLITLAQLATSALSMCMDPRVMPDVRDCKMLQDNPDPRLTKTDVFAALVNGPGLRKVILLVDEFQPGAMQAHTLPQRPVFATVQEEQFGEEVNKDVDLLTKREKPDGAIDRIMMKTAEKGFSGGIKLAKANPKTAAVLAAAGIGAAAYGLMETYFKTHKTVHVYHRTANDTSKSSAFQTETKTGDDAGVLKRSLAGEQDVEPAQKRGFFAITMAEMAAKKAYKHAKKGGNFIRENPELSVAAGAGAMALGAYGLLQAKMASQQTLTVVDHGGGSGGDGNKKNIEKWVTQGHLGRKRASQDNVAMNRGDSMLVGRRAPPLVVGDRLVKRKLVLQGVGIAASNPGVVDTIMAATERDRESQGSAGRPERNSSPSPSIQQRTQPTLGEEALSNRMDLLVGGSIVVGAASVTLATMLRILRS